MRNAYTDKLGETITMLHKGAFSECTNMEFIAHVAGAFDVQESDTQTAFHVILNNSIVTCYSPASQTWYCKY